MKKNYIPPFIDKNQSIFMNKFAYNNFMSIKDKIDGVPVTDLISEFGSPLFVFSENTIRYKYQELSEAMKMHYPNTQLSWSYKTNYLSAICSVYHQEGAKAEIVSGMEYEIAKSLGIKGSDIIFNGPGKRKAELVTAVEDDVLIHIDHLEELQMLEEIASELDKRPQVAIRVNMDTGIYPQWFRFGFNYDNGEALRTVQRLISRNKLDLVGLHSHIGTFILDSNAYYNETAVLLSLAQEIKDKFKIIVKYIDVGGGFASANSLHNNYTPGEFSSPTLAQYAEAIGKAFNESAFVREHNPLLILETGRALIDDAGYLISSVIGKKYLPSGERAVILDAGVNILITAWWYNLKVRPAQKSNSSTQATIFYGPLCMNIDMIKPAAPFPDVKQGEQVVISPVGAYNVTQWMQFIDYRPNVVMISETGKAELIRSRENIQDVIAKHKVPEHLRIV